MGFLAGWGSSGIGRSAAAEAGQWATGFECPSQRGDGIGLGEAADATPVGTGHGQAEPVQVFGDKPSQFRTTVSHAALSS